MKTRAIIPIFLANKGCAEGCIFCNQQILNDTDTPLEPHQVGDYLAQCLKCSKRAMSCSIEVAFYGGNFTGIAQDEQEAYLRAVDVYRKNGQVASVRISTRPDYITQEIVELASSYGVRVIELGVQSMDQEVLRQSRRSYTAAEVRRAVRTIHAAGIDVGIHLMLDLPGDTVAKSLQSAEEVIRLCPAFVRIHPTLVLRDTPLATLYQERKYIPWEEDRVVEVIKALLRRFREAGIPIARIGLQPSVALRNPENVLAGTRHPALRERCESLIFADKMRALADHFDKWNGQTGQPLRFAVHPRDLSKAIGYAKENLKMFRNLYRRNAVVVETSPDVARGSVKLRQG
jgi:histone acetyltransferase (RNA polymerase elongator complex component)